MYATCVSMAPKLRDIMEERVERQQEVEDGVQCCGSLSLEHDFAGHSLILAAVTLCRRPVYDWAHKSSTMEGKGADSLPLLQGSVGS